MHRLVVSRAKQSVATATRSLSIFNFIPKTHFPTSSRPTRVITRPSNPLQPQTRFSSTLYGIPTGSIMYSAAALSDETTEPFDRFTKKKQPITGRKPVVGGRSNEPDKDTFKNRTESKTKERLPHKFPHNPNPDNPNQRWREKYDPDKDLNRISHSDYMPDPILFKFLGNLRYRNIDDPTICFCLRFISLLQYQQDNPDYKIDEQALSDTSQDKVLLESALEQFDGDRNKLIYELRPVLRDMALQFRKLRRETMLDEAQKERRARQERIRKHNEAQAYKRRMREAQQQISELNDLHDNLTHSQNQDDDDQYDDVYDDYNDVDNYDDKYGLPPPAGHIPAIRPKPVQKSKFLETARRNNSMKKNNNNNNNNNNAKNDNNNNDYDDGDQSDFEDNNDRTPSRRNTNSRNNQSQSSRNQRDSRQSNRNRDQYDDDDGYDDNYDDNYNNYGDNPSNQSQSHNNNNNNNINTNSGNNRNNAPSKPKRDWREVMAEQEVKRSNPAFVKAANANGRVRPTTGNENNNNNNNDADWDRDDM